MAPRTPLPDVSLETVEREATRLFAEQGYPVVGMRDIGDAVGLLPGSLYARISSKEALLQLIVEHGVQNFLHVIEPIATGDGSPAERIRHVVVAFARTLDATFAQAQIAFYQWIYLSPEGKEAVIALRRHYEQLYVDMVEDGIAASEFRRVPHARVAVHIMLGTVHSLCHWYSPGGELDIDTVAQMVADSVLSGLCAA